MPRQRLVLLLVAVLVAAAAVGVALVFVGSGGGSSPGASGSTVSTTQNQESALAKVRQKGLELGSASAPNTLYVFEDPQCPYCKQWSLDSVPTTVSEFVKSGRVKLELRPIEVIGSDSEPGIRAVYAAAQKNKGWNMLEALYQRQGSEETGWITSAVIAAAADEAGVAPSFVASRLSSAAVTAAWRAGQTQAQQWGIAGTPSFVLVKQLGTPQQVNPGSLEPTDFAAALRAALQ